MDIKEAMEVISDYSLNLEIEEFVNIAGSNIESNYYYGCPEDILYKHMSNLKTLAYNSQPLIKICCSEEELKKHNNAIEIINEYFEGVIIAKKLSK